MLSTQDSDRWPRACAPPGTTAQRWLRPGAFLRQGQAGDLRARVTIGFNATPEDECGSSQSTPGTAGPLVAFGRHSRTARPRSHHFSRPPHPQVMPKAHVTLRSRSDTETKTPVHRRPSSVVLRRFSLVSPIRLDMA